MRNWEDGVMKSLHIREITETRREERQNVRLKSLSVSHVKSRALSIHHRSKGECRMMELKQGGAETWRDGVKAKWKWRRKSSFRLMFMVYFGTWFTLAGGTQTRVTPHTYSLAFIALSLNLASHFGW